MTGQASFGNVFGSRTTTSAGLTSVQKADVLKLINSAGLTSVQKSAVLNMLNTKCIIIEKAGIVTAGEIEYPSCNSVCNELTSGAKCASSFKLMTGSSGSDTLYIPTNCDETNYAQKACNCCTT